MMVKIFLLYFFVFFTFVCTAQNLSIPISLIDNQKFLAEVKQLDQFMKRFNNKEYILTGNEKSNADILKEKENPIAFQTERKQAILSLFNFSDSNLVYNEKTVEFINYVGNDSNHIELNFFDNNWYAKVNCTISYKGKEQIVDITLKNEGNNKEGFKWVISGLNETFFNISPNRTDTSKFISPMNHELGFMDLHNAFTDSKNITDYTSKNFYPDNLSVFLFLVKSGEIKYVQVNAIKYHFLQVKNWRFTVEHFNRPDNNAGWLISSLVNCSDSDKMNYKKTVLSLR